MKLNTIMKMKNDAKREKRNNNNKTQVSNKRVQDSYQPNFL